MTLSICFWFLLALLIAVVVGGMVLLEHNRDNIVASLAGLALIFLGACGVLATIILHNVATGKAHYQLLENPDGSKTWELVHTENP